MTASSSPSPPEEQRGGWTGGQYSLYRALLSFAIAGLLAARLTIVSGPPAALLGIGLVGCLLLALGWHDRGVASFLFLLVATVAALIDGAPLVLPGAGITLAGILLLFHLAVPPKPFGARDARGRTDPRGGWHRPRWIGDSAWMLLALVLLGRGLGRVGDLLSTPAELDFALLAGVGVLIEIAFALTTFRRSLRPTAWLVMLLWRIAWIAAFGAAPGEPILLLLLVFACDPGWWPGRSLEQTDETSDDAGPAVLYYDGDCGLCHGFVRLVLCEEATTPEPLRPRFAPLSSEHFARQVADRSDVDAPALPDSIVLVLGNGRLLTRSAAVLEIASRLGGFWRALSLVGRLLPTNLLDRGYDGIARIRKRLTTRPNESCPLLPTDLRTRFES